LRISIRPPCGQKLPPVQKIGKTIVISMLGVGLDLRQHPEGLKISKPRARFLCPRDAAQFELLRRLNNLNWSAQKKLSLIS
jgi:hypothetical protein